MNHVEITFLGSEIFERSGRSLFSRASYGS